MDALGVSNRPGIVSPSYEVFRQQEADTFNPKSLEMLLKTAGYIEHFDKVSTGLHSSRLRFYPQMFIALKIGCPDRREQGATIECVEKESEKAISLLNHQVLRLKKYKAWQLNSAATGMIKISGVSEPASEASEVA